MQILTVLLGLTAIWSVAVASPPACDTEKITECRPKDSKNQEMMQKIAATQLGLAQMTLQDGKELCKEYFTVRDCVGGSEKLEECLPNETVGKFGTSHIEDVCNDEDKLKGWVCIMQQFAELKTGIQGIQGTCEGAKKFRSETLASLTEKCGEKIRGDLEEGLDQFIEAEGFCE